MSDHYVTELRAFVADSNMRECEESRTQALSMPRPSPKQKLDLGSLVSEGAPPELGGVRLGDAEVVPLKQTIGKDGL